MLLDDWGCELGTLNNSWVSSSGAGRFHIETDESAAKNGSQFKALCGDMGEALFIHGTVNESLKCRKCIEITKVPSVHPPDGKGAEEVTSKGSAPGRFDASVNRMIEITDDYLNEIEAEREGGDIQHSGYPEPDGRWL